MTVSDGVMTSVPAPWLDASVPAHAQRIVRRALADVGLLEMPPGSNRSPRIDAYLRAVGSPLGSSWCAAAVAAWWRDVGVRVPPAEAGSCAAWERWARSTGAWREAPSVGSAVLYGMGDVALHMGVVVRIAPLVLSVEGNTTLTGFGADGEAVTLKRVALQRVRGYVVPVTG